MVTTAQEPASVDLVKNVTDFLSVEMTQVQRLLEETLQSDSRLIREVGQYVSLTHGKKLRPLITLLMARMFAPDKPSPVHVGAAVELIHVATLIHDDVIDKAKLRRGRPSVNARWGDDVAILMADYLYARAFDLALQTLSPAVMRVITQVTQKMCEGEMFQIEWRDRPLTAEDYFRVVERKTGQLFSACAALGAMAAGRREADINAARGFGMDFGVAFQITDDTLDYLATDERWGKDIGMDVSGCKQTLPLLMALDGADPEERRRVQALRAGGADFKSLLDFVRARGGVERALEHARGFAQRGLDRLSALNPADPAAFEYLSALPGYVVGRLF